MKLFSRTLRIGILGLALTLLNCQQLMDLLDEKNKVDDTAASTNTDLDKAGSWTILVYLDAANNLEGAGVQDVQEMVDAGTLSGNKYYVLMDRMTGFSTASNTSLPANFTGSLLFSVLDGVTAPITPGTPSVPYPGNPNWPTGVTGGAGDEVNMGDRKTLENFIIYGLKKAEQDQTDYVYLDIWDHGAGWGGGAYGGNAVAWDDETGTPHDALSIDEIRTAIANAYAAVPNKKITIIGFDACYMGTIENAYSFKDYAKIMVASEELEPGAGWQYKNWTPKGKVSPRAVATNVVTTFKASYSAGGEQVTLSAIDLSKVGGISSALDVFLSKISSQSSSAIASARQQSQSFNNDMSVDIYDFVSRINMPESTAVKNMIKASIVAEAHTEGGKVAGSNGLTVYFPQSQSNYDAQYDATNFAKETRWDDFISGKLASFEISSAEPGDASCGAESNDTAAKAIKIAPGTVSSCTGYIYTPSDVDIYRIGANGIGAAGGTITVTLSNIPAGNDFDVLLFNTNVSPSAPLASGVKTGNTSESFTINLGTGQVTYGADTCYPTGTPSAVLLNQGLCYGEGVFGSISPATTSNDFYIVVVGKSNSYSQVGKYTLSVSAAGGSAITQVP